MNVSATGMRAGQVLLDPAAQEVARVDAAGQPPGADVARHATRLLTAHTVYTANARALTITTEPARSLLDVRG